MPLVQIGEKSVYFVHCPKAGGSSIEAYLRDTFGEVRFHNPAWNIYWCYKNGWQGRTGRSSPQHLLWHDAEAQLQALNAMPDAVFAVVRDPLARLQSEYRYQMQHRPYPRLARWFGWMSFSTWLRTMLIARRMVPHLFDNHFQPQVHLMPKGTAQIFHLEDGVEPVTAYLHSLAPDVQRQTIPHELQSQAHSKPTEASRQDLAWIATAYAEDYAQLGYTAPDQMRAKRDWLSGTRTSLAVLIAPVVAMLYRRGKV